jgi:hypothetical protein
MAILVMGVREVPIAQLLQRILSRVFPQDRKNLEQFLINVMIFIKKARGMELTELEQLHPAHPDFAHYHRREGIEAANILHKTLRMIDRYKMGDAREIIDTIVSTPLVSATSALKPLHTRILMELYRNPLSRVYQLANRLSTTIWHIRNAIHDLGNNCSFTVVHHSDPQKFKLTQQAVLFRTKSIDDSKHFDEKFLQKRPQFLRLINFDSDYRRGILSYLVPDQPKGRQMFNQHIEALKDEFFEECLIVQRNGIFQAISFEGYDFSTGRWMFETEILAEALLRFTKENSATIPSPKGIEYGNPIRFDRADFIIAQTAFSLPYPRDMDLRHKLLNKLGVTLAKKTVWARERRLRQEGVFFSTPYFRIPDFQENVLLDVKCQPEDQAIVKRLPSMLPNTLISPSEHRVGLGLQMPTRSAALLRQLIRAISSELESKVDILRLTLTRGTTTIPGAADRWDASRQRWVLQEDDFNP